MGQLFPRTGEGVMAKFSRVCGFARKLGDQRQQGRKGNGVKGDGEGSLPARAQLLGLLSDLWRHLLKSCRPFQHGRYR